MTVKEALGLPVAFGLDISNRAFSLGRAKGYALAKSGEYPVPVLRLGNSYRVRRADVLAALGIDDQRAA